MIIFLLFILSVSAATNTTTIDTGLTVNTLLLLGPNVLIVLNTMMLGHMYNKAMGCRLKLSDCMELDAFRMVEQSTNEPSV